MPDTWNGFILSPQTDVKKKKINNKTAERERERGGDSSVVQCPDSSFLLKSGPTPPDDSERANSRKVH